MEPTIAVITDSDNYGASPLDLFIFLSLILITVTTYPTISSTFVSHVPISFVWFYGWITAISTGLGALPFVFVKEPNKFWMGISNGLNSANICLIVIASKIVYNF
jgi:hypothetical protein